MSPLRWPRSAAGWIVLAAPSLLAERVLNWTASFGDAVATYPVPWSLAGVAAYLATPLVVLSSFLVFLLPGLLLCRIRSGGDGLRWILRGFAVSLLVTAALSQVLTAAGSAVTGWPFALLLLITAAGAAVLDGRRTPAQTGADEETGEAALGTNATTDPIADPSLRPFLVTSVLALAALTILLAPKIHWEHFNGDGAHAFESARALLHRVTPFWPEGAGDIAAFPGVTSFLFALPGAVFLRVLGPIEAAARVPALLYLLPLAAGLLGVARRAGAAVGRYQIRVTWVGLALYTTVLAFSATYNAYTADLALPATQDTLLMATFTGYLVAFLDRSPAWMVAFAVLTYAGLPSGPLLIVLWSGAALVFLRPVPWFALAWSVAALTVAVLLGVLGPALLELLGAPVPGDEYAGASLVDRLRDPVLSDVRRLLYWVVPCGIAPALVFLSPRGHSGVGRAVVGVTIGYFAFFYVQQKTALHYYVPAMVLPWIVFWSHRLASPVRESGAPTMWAARSVALGLLLAFALSIPWGYRLDRSAWRVGAAVAERVGGYERSDPAVFRASDLLTEVVPLDWDASVPDEGFGGSPLVWLRYAERGASAPQAPLLLMRTGDVPPAGARRLAWNEAAVLNVTDEAAWRALRNIRPPARAGARIYRIPKATLF